MQEKTAQGSRRFVIATCVVVAHAVIIAVLLIPLGNSTSLWHRAPARQLEITRLFLPPPVAAVAPPAEATLGRAAEKQAPPLRQIPKTPLPRPVLKPRVPPDGPPPIATMVPMPPPTNPCTQPSTGQELPDSPCPDTTRRLILPGGLGLDDQGRITQNPGLMAKPATPEGLAEEKRLTTRTLDKLSSLYGKPVIETPQRYEGDRIPIQGTTPFQTLRGRIDRLFSPPVQKTP